MVSFKKLFGYFLGAYLGVYVLGSLNVLNNNDKLPFNKENVVCARQQLNEVKKKLKDDFTLEVILNSVVCDGKENGIFKLRVHEPKGEEVHSRLMDYIDKYSVTDVFNRYDEYILELLDNQKFLEVKQNSGEMGRDSCMKIVGDLLFEKWSKEVESRKSRLVAIAVKLEDLENDDIFKWIKSFLKK